MTSHPCKDDDTFAHKRVSLRSDDNIPNDHSSPSRPSLATMRRPRKAGEARHRSSNSTASQCGVCGNRSTAIAFTGTNGGPPFIPSGP